MDEYMNTPGRKSPTALGMALGLRLRDVRRLSGVEARTAAKHVCLSSPVFSRLERGTRRPRVEEAAGLLSLYESHGTPAGTDVEEFLQLVKLAGEPGWWEQHKRVIPRWFDRFIGLQEAATWIRTYEYQLVPGLLQTEEYAREVVKIAYLLAGPDEVEERVRLRLARQELLTAPGAPRVQAVIHEAVLHTSIGGPDVMRRQLEHLEQAGQREGVVVQILPFATTCLALGSPMTLLRSDGYRLPEIVYIEQGQGASYIDQPSETEHYSAQMSQLAISAASIEMSQDMLRTAIERLS
ncbi:helix-turn-helix domain-containing protein [Streptomyces exfoliatus]|uniref:helix-turn-helix domain-containing protein n=1 Tax=Streptomyces exfoliatus TaxID=1905 RepID=UPI00379BAD94